MSLHFSEFCIQFLVQLFLLWLNIPTLRSKYWIIKSFDSNGKNIYIVSLTLGCLLSIANSPSKSIKRPSNRFFHHFRKKIKMDGNNFDQIEFLDQGELALLRVEAENEELRRLNSELWSELFKVNEEFANFESEHQELEEKCQMLKNNLNKRLKKIEKRLKIQR